MYVCLCYGFFSWLSSFYTRCNVLKASWPDSACIGLQRVNSAAGCWMRACHLCHTSLDWRMLLKGIHSVPTMVSQIKPLFQTSTFRPRSSLLISLGERGMDEKNERDFQHSHYKDITGNVRICQDCIT